VELPDALRGVPPAERARPVATGDAVPLAQLRVAEQPPDRVREPVGVARRVLALHHGAGRGPDLDEGGRVGVDDRGAEAERLDDGQAEALGQAGVDEQGRPLEHQGQVGVGQEAEAPHALRCHARLARHPRKVEVAPALRADDEEGEAAGLGSGEGPDERLEALPRLERAHGQQEVLRQVEVGGPGVRVVRRDDRRRDRAADDAHAVAEVEVLRQLLGDRVRRYDDGVRVPAGALRHGLVPAHAVRGERLGVRPRHDVVDRHHDLGGVVDRIVAVQGREQARRVDHAAGRGRGDAELPRGRELAAGEAAPGQARQPAQPPLEVLRHGGRNGGDDALDGAVAGGGRDQLTGQLLGVPADSARHPADHLVDDHPQRRRHSSS
jgi:hypothetical protein